jgi:hypothetical protein
MIDHDSLSFVIIMRQVHEDFGDAEMQVLDQVDVVILPTGRWNIGPW